MKCSGLSRAELLKTIFPDGPPILWCPPLTHFDRNGEIDRPRTVAHLTFLSQFVKGFLIPGSTGDGWALNAQETTSLLEIALDQAKVLKFQFLIGVLRPDATECLTMIQHTIEWLKSRTNESDPAKAMAKTNVCGFAICARRGKEKSQDEIRSALSAILELGYPTALYQLPQMTQNEISPEVADELAARFPNFILFKDSSGADRVVLSAKNLTDVWSLRGGEGDYTRWIKTAGGPYHGFLLGSANSFAHQYVDIFSKISAGKLEQAEYISSRITNVIREVPRLVANLAYGHPFSNRNKAMEHFFAFGPGALNAPPPFVIGGGQLPVELLRATADLLTRNDLMPAKGYLE